MFFFFELVSGKHCSPFGHGLLLQGSAETHPFAFDHIVMESTCQRRKNSGVHDTHGIMCRRHLDFCRHQTCCHTQNKTDVDMIGLNLPFCACAVQSLSISCSLLSRTVLAEGAPVVVADAVPLDAKVGLERSLGARAPPLPAAHLQGARQRVGCSLHSLSEPFNCFYPKELKRKTKNVILSLSVRTSFGMTATFCSSMNFLNSG